MENAKFFTKKYEKISPHNFAFFLHLINFPIVFAQNFAAIFASQFFPEKLAQKFVVTFAEILAIAKIIENIYGFFWKMQNFSQKIRKKITETISISYMIYGPDSLKQTTLKERFRGPKLFDPS